MSYAYVVLDNGIPVAGGPLKYHCRHWLNHYNKTSINVNSLNFRLKHGHITVWRMSSNYLKPNPTNITTDFIEKDES